MPWYPFKSSFFYLVSLHLLLYPSFIILENHLFSIQFAIEHYSCNAKSDTYKEQFYFIYLDKIWY